MADRLSVGTRLHAMFTDGQYYPAEVLQVSSGQRRARAPVKVRYIGYDASQDAWLGLESLKSKALPPVPGAKAATRRRRRAAAAPLAADPSLLSPGMRLQVLAEDGVRYAAQVLAVSTNPTRAAAPVKVNYLGYAADEDEWVGTDRIRSRAMRVATGRIPRRRSVDNHVSVTALYTVPEGKMDEFKACFKDLYAAVKAGTRGCLYYGFATSSNEAFCRQGYADAASFLAHREEAKEELQKALAAADEGCPKLMATGPAAELAKLKPVLGPEGASFWELDGRSKWYGKKGGLPGQPDTHISVTPSFAVPEGKLEEFRAGFPEFYRAVQAGTRGCLYFGFAVCDGQVICREGYKDAECCLTHLNDVKAPFEKATAFVGKGGVKLTVAGPPVELEKVKAAIDPLGAVYWELDAGTFWR